MPENAALAVAERALPQTLPVLTAHRGFSSRHPEMTRAAYTAAIAWAAETRLPLWLECDVHFSADDQLICLHDLRLDRTSTLTGRAYGLTVEQLKRVDFGSRRVPGATPAERELVTLDELLTMVRDARLRGVAVGVVIETKHPNPRGGAVEDEVAELLDAYGWDQPGSPVRVISFSVTAVQRLRRLLPCLPCTFLIEGDLGRWRSGRLPSGVSIVGPDLLLIKDDPDFVARSHAHGHEVHVWTVNEPEDVDFCRRLGVDGFTTDCPDRVAQALAV